MANLVPAKLLSICQSLGLPAPLYDKLFLECPKDGLIDSGEDVFGRKTTMHRQAFSRWVLMREAARQDGIYLSIVSAFRTYDYQAAIIRRKLEAGLKLSEILSVNAPPGLSEHHTGCALDLTCDEETEVLTETFETTNAFAWLSRHAVRFSFRLSYPRDNPEGYIYEPWHWCYQLK